MALLHSCRLLVCFVWCFSAVVTVFATQLERLPPTLKPYHYQLRLLPHILDGSENATIDGFVQIDFKCIEDSPYILLHGDDISVNLESIKLYDKFSRERFVVERAIEVKGNQIIFLQLRRKTLSKGANYVLSMNFISRLRGPGDRRGFYRMSYLEGGKPSLMALTQLQPTDARLVFPCFDDPSLKADFSITVGRPANMISVSNMPKHRSMPVAELPGYVWDVYHRSFSMSTYLVSIAILDSPSWVSTHFEGIVLNIWARPSLLNQTRHSLKVASKLMGFYQNYLGVEYSLPKQDMIAVPNMDGAMENWGLVIYGEQYLTHIVQTTAAANRELNVLVVAHEMAHQWFGNLVTLDWWTDLWLNEGLATYLSYVAVDDIHPEYEMMQQLVLNEMQKVMYDDALPSTSSVHKPADVATDVNSVFDSISYKKAASLLRMLAESMGHKSFRRGLKRYLKQLEYGNAIEDDLWSAMSFQATVDRLKLPYDIKSYMETWTHHIGYPVVTVARNYSARAVTVSQTRFLLRQKKKFVDDDAQGVEDMWIIPLTFISTLNRQSKLVWMPPLPRVENITYLDAQADEWVIFNVNSTGFYRVNYDERNWDLIWSQLLHDPEQIPTINRAQLVDDAFNLARADLMPYTTALNMAVYLRKETEHAPWRSAFEAFRYVDIMLKRTSAYTSFKQFMIGLVSPIYDWVSFVETPGDDLLTNRLRSEMVKWACHWNHEDCVNKSLSVYREWMARPDDSVVPADLKRAITCTALRHSGLAEWEFASEKFQESNVHAEKSDLLAGMTCSTNTSLLYTMLEWTLNSTKLDDIFFVELFSSMSTASKMGKVLSFDFLRFQWNKLKPRYGPATNKLGIALLNVVSSSNTLSDLEKIKSLRVEFQAEDDPQTSGLLDHLSETIESNVLWMSKHYQLIDEWLHQIRLS